MNHHCPLRRPFFFGFWSRWDSHDVQLYFAVMENLLRNLMITWHESCIKTIIIIIIIIKVNGYEAEQEVANVETSINLANVKKYEEGNNYCSFRKRHEFYIRQGPRYTCWHWQLITVNEIRYLLNFNGCIYIYVWYVCVCVQIQKSNVHQCPTWKNI